MGENDRLIEISETLGVADGVEAKKREDFKYTDIPEFYNRVRSALGALNTQISNDEIDYYENAPSAERNIKSRVPGWVSLSDEDFEIFQTCIVFMTCYNVCPVITNRKISKQTTPSLTLEFAQSTSGEKPCARFLDLVNDLLAGLLDEEIASFTGFRVTQSSDVCCKGRGIWHNRRPN